MDKLADRYDRRMVFPGSDRLPPGPDAIVDAQGEFVGEIARPPSEVWALVASPAGFFEGKDGFVLPGPGPERWCIVEDSPDSMIGALVDVLEREEGRHIALRCVGVETTFVWDWSVFDASPTAAGAASLVRLTLSAKVRGRAVSAAEGGLHRGAWRAVTRIDHLLTGAAPPPPLEGLEDRQRRAEAAHRAHGPLTHTPVDVQVVVPAPVEVAWQGVLDPGSYTVDAAPGERPGLVPGTPAGQVGELRYLVCQQGKNRSVRFHEVVDIGPGCRLVLRHRSAPHPVESVTTVEPHPDGALIRIVCVIATHGDLPELVAAARSALLAHLARLADTIVREHSPGGSTTP